MKTAIKETLNHDGTVAVRETTEREETPREHFDKFLANARTGRYAAPQPSGAWNDLFRAASRG